MCAARLSTSRQEYPQDDLALEGRLFAALNPVQASPEFVSNLKTRLTMSPSVTLEERGDMAAVVVIGFGLFAGVFLAWLAFMIRYLLFRDKRSPNADHVSG